MSRLQALDPAQATGKARTRLDGLADDDCLAAHRGEASDLRARAAIRFGLAVVNTLNRLARTEVALPKTPAFVADAA